jgi:uncharacterized protein DUF4129
VSSRHRVATVVMAALSVALAVGAAHAQQDSARATAENPDRAEIARALEIVKADPNLANERTIKTLRWRQSTEMKPSGNSAWIRWIAGLFRWFEESARLLLWVGLVVLAGLLAVFIARFVRTHGVLRGEATFVVPTHVRDLDIRPESLPADIGIAARVLWDRGDHRAALALLYRGMLSRLAHVHRIPIRDSSTEGDCLALAAGHLTDGRREYASRLVSVWQRFVYGGQGMQTAAVHVLCDGFASALDSASAPDAMRPGNTP